MLLTLTESSLSTFTGNSPTTSTTSTTSSAPPPHSSHPSATSVLAFWFPPNVPSSTLRKTLWMPLTPQLRALADEKVERFRPLIMKILHDENFRRSWFQTARTLLALIVACDQFPRHFARSEAPLSDAEALLASAIAMEACTSLRNLNDGEALEELSGQQLCFCLMPMRHEGNLESIKLVESIVRRREEKMAEEVETLCNFKKATVRRRRAAEDLTRHHAVNVETFDAHDLLDGIDVDNPDMSDVEKTKICKDMVAWLSRERGDIHGGDNRTKVWGGGAKWKRRNGRINAAPGSTSSSRLSSPPAIQRNLRLLVSLSGGVDSMVIAHCLHHLTSRFNVELTCCHVDYGNRRESGAEADWVRNWCEKRGIRCVIRKVSGARRGEGDRDEYEKRTRDVRYGLYRELIEETGARGVIFGHHSGDVVENVITNAFKGKSVLSLSGMKGEGKVEGVTVLRPLIDLSKQDVYDYAERYGVGYFKDTTPSWSTRGRVRNELLPVLNDVFGNGYEGNLEALGKGSDQVRDVVDGLIVHPFMRDASLMRGGGWFDATQGRGKTPFWWETVLLSFLHGLGVGMLSSKSTKVLVNHAELEGVESRWLQLRPDCGTYLRDDGLLFVLNKRAFRWGKDGERWRERVRSSGFRMHVGSRRRIGEWFVSATMVIEEVKEGEEHEARNLVKSKPWQSLESLVRGQFSYCILVKTPKHQSVRGMGGLSPAVSPTTPTRASSPSIRIVSPPRKASTFVTSVEFPVSFPNLTLLPHILPKSRAGKPHALQGVHEKLVNALPLLDAEQRVDLEEESWERHEGFNVSVVRVLGQLRDADGIEGEDDYGVYDDFDSTDFSM